MKPVSEKKLLPVWVSPDHLVTTAKLIMQGHHMKNLAVLEGKRLIGVVSLHELPSDPPEQATVRDYFHQPAYVVDAEMPIRRVAEMFYALNLDFAPVVGADDKYLGMITATMLLEDLLRTWDPITGLSWSDRLRDWGIENLKLGNEITIIFVDIDDFGLYNKKFGHVIGDRVLKMVADSLRASVDEDRDMLVRYGGDEFVIGTTRMSASTHLLMEEIRDKINEQFVKDVEHEVFLTMGYAGGRRTKERDNMHYAATLDNLINLASQECQLQKLAKKAESRATQQAVVQADPTLQVEGLSDEIPQVAPQSAEIIGEIISVDEVYADERTPGGLTTVLLSKGANVASGVHARAGGSMLESVVYATAKALERLDPNLKVLFDEILLDENPQGLREVRVVGRYADGEQQLAMSATRVVEQSLAKTAALAAIDAVQSVRSRIAK